MNRLLTLALFSAALAAPAVAQTEVSDRDSSGVSPLAALDQVASTVIKRAIGSVVLIDVERQDYGPRPLTGAERAGLGVTGRYDPRYFSRPEGPVNGVVIGPNLIATASFNLAGDGAVHVIKPDGERLPATRLGHDQNLDLSLLRVDGDLGMPAIKPSQRALVPGRFLFLVSRNQDDQPMVTTGIVSALGRYHGDAFAHSCRTSYANMGGALVDLDGDLVGFSVRHGNHVRQGQNSGVGFGVTSAQLDQTKQRLLAGEVIERRKTPFLGIQADITATGGPGVRIQAVIPDTAAAKAGLKAGDWIKIFNQVEIESFNQLRDEIQALGIGTQIVVTIVRDGQEQDVRVELGGRVEDE